VIERPSLTEQTGSRPAVPLGITMGCPAGIGPEIIVKLFEKHTDFLHYPPAAVLGDMNILRKASQAAGTGIRLREWRPGAPLQPGVINVCPVTELDISAVRWGRASPVTGRASFLYIEQGIKYSMNGSLSGIVTAPVSKTGLRLAGIDYPGHTEIFADHTGCSRYAMMMAGDKLRVVLVTIHLPIRDVPGRISLENIRRTIEITASALKWDFCIPAPSIAVAGLNPHGGEGGMFGTEEADIIAPAIEEVRRSGVDASGPFPPDTVFYQAAAGRFDAVICQYHDQGLIPFKLLHFKDGVNVTIGLPLVRTSVDHGTAYDIAGQGTADCSSLEAALILAGRIVDNRRHLANSDTMEAVH